MRRFRHGIRKTKVPEVLRLGDVVFYAIPKWEFEPTSRRAGDARKGLHQRPLAVFSSTNCPQIKCNYTPIRNCVNDISSGSSQEARPVPQVKRPVFSVAS